MAVRNFSGTGSRRRLGADASLALVILLLGAFLAASGAQLAQRLQASAARRQSVSFEDHIGVVANTTGLIVVVWWALSFLIALVSAVLERGGSRRAAAAAGKFSPAFMRRLALAALGLQLAAAPLAHAAPGPGGPGAPPPPAVAAAWIPTGGAPGGTTSAAVPAPMTLRALEPPDPRPGPGSLGPDPHWTPAPPPVAPGSLAAGPLRAQEPAPGMVEKTVRAGDSLWSICAAELGPLASDVDIARAWPRLYQANREVIGGDPGLLLPGQVLRMPFAP
ncbi:LysM peptidoglycan-binding domain-containing protein [Arthrobacter sp. 2YAF22_2]|uniref:LysM peptidoglycan-binding domain-containing protein n=1 Tax=Arthrobacter sp. 2YAF22_2 TaxID=3233029 RepID=UPI003F93CADB